jgi:hypothetical protein
VCRFEQFPRSTDFLLQAEPAFLKDRNMGNLAEMYYLLGFLSLVAVLRLRDGGCLLGLPDSSKNWLR